MAKESGHITKKSSPQRQLAAIVFSDITGYTAMMGSDEDSALVLLERYKFCHESRAEEYGGDIIQYYGDACLMIFQSAFDAIKCSEALQLDFREEPKVPVRIGVHLGDIVRQDGNIFGDSVNVASRVESMGIPGAILFSETICRSIQGHPDLMHQSLGTFEFKNVDEPLEIFALKNHDFPVPRKDQMKGKLKPESADNEKKEHAPPQRSRLSVKILFGVIGLLAVSFIAWKVYIPNNSKSPTETMAQEADEEIPVVEPVDSGTILDERDGQEYKWAQFPIGPKWIVQNLNFKTEGSNCYDKASNCTELGQLYRWEDALSACPIGWKLPGADDWDKLIASFGGREKAFIGLSHPVKSTFAINFGGVLDDGNSFNYLGESGNYWTDSVANEKNAWHINFTKQMGKVFILSERKDVSFSCRCVESEEE